MHQVFVSIGSNIEPSHNIEEAKIILGGLFDCTFSGLYETSAEGFIGNNFINCVVGFETNLQLIELKEKFKQIEKKMGRTDDQKGMSNRVIDLDIILFGDKVIQEDDFDIPSKDIENYLFVLEPLVEISGDLLHPILKKTYSEILIDLKAS
jgi:2-amino-4-hydroxy-6-hydroxymethyldihydropteridine diphosphokinase